jgi:formylglycine-generating enzyme required for sulfatase activity
VNWGREGFGLSRLNHPVVTVTWYEAMAFCRWLTQHLNDGFVYTLPSEAEWEYATRGGQRRIYPWGDVPPDAERVHFGNHHDGPTAVGCFAAGRTPGTGIADLAGLVWEWTRSEYRPYPYDPTDGREDVTDARQKSVTLRGGGWGQYSRSLRASYRLCLTSHASNFDVGFRLARHPHDITKDRTLE